jgi:hypothetical protein
MKSRIALSCTVLLLLIATSAQAAGDGREQKTTQNKTVAEPADRSNGQVKSEPVARPAEVTPAPEKTPGTTKTVPESPKQVVDNPGSSDAQRHGRGGDRGGYNPPPSRYDHRGGWSDWGRDWGWHGRFRTRWDFVLPAPIVVTYPVPAPTLVVPRRNDFTVCVVYAGTDALGSNFSYSVRDYLQSYGLTLVTSPDDASLELYITSTDEDPVHAGSASAISVSYIWNPGTFVTAQAFSVGSLSAGTQAKSVASYADQLILQNQ